MCLRAGVHACACARARSRRRVYKLCFTRRLKGFEDSENELRMNLENNTCMDCCLEGVMCACACVCTCACVCVFAIMYLCM